MAPRATFGFRDASRRWWVVLVVLLVASVWAYRARVAPVPVGGSRFSGFAQGTTYSIVLGTSRTPQRLAALQHAVDSTLVEIDRAMSTYDSTSEISRLNRAEANVAFPLSAPLAGVLAEAADAFEATAGLFDVTVGPLVKAWGFGPSGAITRAPTGAELDRLRAGVGFRHLQLAGREVTKLRPDVSLDLNAIAPGYSVDRLSALLLSLGEVDHFVELGGEVRARGTNLQGRPFRVGIEEPDTTGRRVRLAVLLTDRALSTSGTYRNYRDVGGIRYVHTIDPRTGRPVTHRLLSVTVLHERCAMADAWATALMVVGPEQAWSLAQANDLDVLLLIAGPDGKVVERMTTGFADLVERIPRPATEPKVP